MVTGASVATLWTDYSADVDDLVDPRGVVGTPSAAAAGTTLPSRLVRRTVGLLDNSKTNADLLLDEVRLALSAARPDLGFVQVRKSTPALAVDEGDLHRLVTRCDAVVLASAD